MQPWPVSNLQDKKKIKVLTYASNAWTLEISLGSSERVSYHKTKRRLINFMVLIVWKFGGEEAEVMKIIKCIFQ